MLATRRGRGQSGRTPALGLFLDLEIRLLEGPVFVGEPYARRAARSSGSARAGGPSRTGPAPTLTDVDTACRGRVVLLHSGMFKESYPGYPAERLG